MDLKLDKTKNLLDEAEKICDEFNIPIIFFTTAPHDSFEKNRLQKRCLFQPIPFTTEEITDAVDRIFKIYPFSEERT